MRGLPIVLIIAALAFALGSTASEIAEITPGEPFRLAVGEAAALPSKDLTVRFSGVVGDSRCPSDVTCVWAGDAQVDLRLERSDDEISVSLHTHGSGEAQAFGCTLRLLDLRPYPKSTVDIAPEDYMATLELTVNEPSGQTGH
ncbi:MAG: hypothetical protein GY719_37400 [bacterium]|nr:hypothetical protein [bacterium]